tara:strand:- start:3381 stop:4085 length:705 start_codon:yes stop_codon:yes gene_type:complete
MEKEAIIGNVFGKTIYKTSIKDHQEINKKIKPLIEKFVKEKPGTVAATTDVKGNLKATILENAIDDLHLQDDYKELFKELALDIKEFMAAKSYDDSKFDINITKAWATFTSKGQNIPSHKHTASHFSCVYYVHNEGMGDIKFEQELYSHDGFFIPPTDAYIKEWNQFNFASYKFEVQSGDFIIFPSGLLHQTETNTKDTPRISISADILLTMREGVSTEHCIPSPKSWKTIYTS